MYNNLYKTNGRDLNYYKKLAETIKIASNNSYTGVNSDLSKIEIIDDNNFIEYTKDGYPTNFVITRKKELEEYRFKMKNTNIKGNWIGKFNEISEGIIEIDFTEEIEVSNPIMKIFAKIYLKNQQKRYIKDLDKKKYQYN